MVIQVVSSDSKPYYKKPVDLSSLLPYILNPVALPMCSQLKFVLILMIHFGLVLTVIPGKWKFLKYSFCVHYALQSLIHRALFL